jgi:cytoskeletal protein CcmA (bactofilin family)
MKEDRPMLTRDNQTRRIEDKAGPVESTISRETTLQGSLRSEHGIRIMGSVEGDIESRGRVRIERDGRVRGDIAASDVIVNGGLEGDIKAAGQIELGPECRMVGNIKAAKIAIAEGCSFQGDIRMSGGDGRPLSFIEKRSAKTDAPA